MRNLIIVVLLSVIGTAAAYSQRIEVGLRDNSYLHANYRSKSGWITGYEQSLLNASVKEQNGRLFAGYVLDKEQWDISGTAYYGTEYTGNWQAYGAFVEGLYHTNHFYVDGILNPHYDTGLEFDFCYRLEAGISLWRKQENSQRLELCASYGNVPEYRQATDNFRAGFKFTSGNLWVKPMLCVPITDNESGQKYLRVICSFGWSMQL